MDGGNEAGRAAQFHKAFDVMNEIHDSADTHKISIYATYMLMYSKKALNPLLPADMKGPLCFVLVVLVQECCRVGTSWLHQSVVNHWAQGLHVYIRHDVDVDRCLFVRILS